MFKLDLHTHSTESPDGGISLPGYQQALDNGVIDYVAITDHNTIDFAVYAKEMLGDKMIIGEEIMSNAGEIIGLFLSKRIKPGMSPKATIQAIKDQNGVVYIPHPFETMRKGLHPQIMDELADHIDIVEVCNGRAFLQNRSEQAVVWTRLNPSISAASSDAHGISGLGKTYITIAKPPTRDTILKLVGEGTLVTGRPNLRSLLYPKYHRMRRKLGKK